MSTKISVIRTGIVAIVVVVLVLFSQNPASAHCDTLDGPVVNTARAALDAGDVIPVLKWVKSAQEAEIRETFERTLSVRKLGFEAKELADMYFFETLVRLHRAGEGAPYTGLKQAGEVEPAIAAADKALESGVVDDLIKEIQHEVGNEIKERFERVIETGKHKDKSVDAGREFVRHMSFMCIMSRRFIMSSPVMQLGIKVKVKMLVLKTTFTSTDWLDKAGFWKHFFLIVTSRYIISRNIPLILPG